MKNTITAAYLYADGHAITLHQRYDSQSRQTLEWVEAIEQVGPSADCIKFTGRIVFHRYHVQALLALTKMSESIRASGPSTERGTEKSKALGLAYSSLSFHLKGSGELYMQAFPDVCSPGWCVQPDSCERSLSESFADLRVGQQWGCNSYLTKIHYKKPAKAQLINQAKAA